ncbi:MAG TPA: hypothetical protein PKC98_10055 [Candidatus Melainabacteria bacterium]|nr:hypothetical protein [Candidatus Melainabacteria bacterium]
MANLGRLLVVSAGLALVSGVAEANSTFAGSDFLEAAGAEVSLARLAMDSNSEEPPALSFESLLEDPFKSSKKLVVLAIFPDFHRYAGK